MPGKLYKSMLAAVAVLLLIGAGLCQNRLVQEREDLGLTRYTELKGAPPVLALTTVALGGFRGLISNLLWIRASDLQEQDKYFEMVQLADWITKLEPHFTQVWLVQAWNMAYNISVKFKDPSDRWRWVQRGLELLRDDGLRYNPHDVLIHRELAWFFQHKMGANLDDAHLYYKQAWANEMAEVFGKDKAPNLDELINPKTDDERKRSALLREKFKMDPRFMKEVDERYGPLEWRLPEAHAIYWAAQGLEQAKLNEKRINPDDLITLRRVIYQSMQLSFQRGRLISDKVERKFEFGPNLAIIPRVNAAYEQAMEDDPKNRDHIEIAQRNFFRDAAFFLYTYNKEGEAIKWYKLLAEKYPDKGLLDFELNSLPKNLSLDDYAIARIQGEVGDAGREKTKAVLEGLERQAFKSLAVDEEDRYIGLDHLAQKIWQHYADKIKGDPEARLKIPPLKEIKQDVLQRLLTDELSTELAAQLCTKLGIKMPPPKAALPEAAGASTPASATNALPAKPVEN